MTKHRGDNPRGAVDLAFPLRILVGAGFGAIVVLTIAQVFFRFALNSPLVWSEELSRLLLVWVTFIGAAVICWDGTLLNVDVIFVRIPMKFRRPLRAFNGAVALVFLAVLAWHSIKMVEIEHITTLGSMDIPASFLRVPATIGGVLMIVFILLRRFYRLRREKAAQGDAFSDHNEPM